MCGLHMDICCVIQARTGSTRFPRKVLADLNGRSVLRFMLERLYDLPVSHMIVATSTETADDEVADAAEAAGADVVRGPHEDVLSRFAMAVERYPSDAIVRLTADCPLSDRRIVAEAIDRMRQEEVDFLGNTLIRTFPKGLDVEVVSRDALVEAANKAADPFEREHVMPYIYRRPETHTLASFRTTPNLAHLRWTVDTPDDLDHIRRLVAGLDPTAFGWQDLLSREDVSKPPGFQLRIAEPHDLEMIGQADPVTEGADQAAAELAADHTRLTDGARRVWVIERNGDPLGWCRVSISDGGLGRMEAGSVGEFAAAFEVIPPLVGGQLARLRATLREPWIQAALRAGYKLGQDRSTVEWERNQP
jgi:spore coat polysaccharide biosynthesis protein SpsF